jgi:hypothetical protein
VISNFLKLGPGKDLQIFLKYKSTDRMEKYLRAGKKRVVLLVVVVAVVALISNKQARWKRIM